MAYVEYSGRRMDAGELSLNEIQHLMARHFPELAEPKVETKFEGEGKDKTTVYVFTRQAGRKGARASELEAVASALVQAERFPILSERSIALIFKTYHTASDVARLRRLETDFRECERLSGLVLQRLLDLPAVPHADAGGIL